MESEEGTLIVVNDEFVTLDTPNGPMRTHIVRPAAPGRYPGIVFYSEIFQITPPIRRTAVFFAGHGYIVAMPEIYHEFEPAGTVFAYDQAGSDRGNALKTTKHLASYDADARAALDHLAARTDSTGKLGALGICIGGHLAFRAAMNRDVLGTACFYATDIHKGGLGAGMQDDSLERAKDIHGELLMIWGRQDPHIPLEGRMKVLTRLNELALRLSWIEVNGAHAFMRDEGPRYDPELAYNLYGTVLAFFHRKLAQGDLPAASVGAAETRH
jgi:carboxymethylenebutenolidase